MAYVMRYRTIKLGPPFNAWTVVEDTRPAIIHHLERIILWPLWKYKAWQAKRQMRRAAQEVIESAIYSFRKAIEVLDSLPSLPYSRDDVRAFFKDMDTYYGTPSQRFINTDPLLSADRLPD